ncbi:methionine ABC transporter permease [Streptomyces sp. SAJ15]|uniref:methionine ABC transporter permease n=1 Tax=Streptomyces sp. SAJ15 TaxID=2011095 RepID=UPI00118566D2|nr:methionine ABC transporter permease [Streptomyces sp. SAJ15]TVL93126.1 ABC transporter permease [Streptomyces sp. SAJ15]
MTWSEMQPLLEQAGDETFHMVGWSALIAILGGLPLGVLLVLTDRGGLLQNVVVNKVLGQTVNIARSMPFVILMVALMSVTRWVVGTTIGPDAAIVPLSIGAIPFFARLVETSVREVDPGLVEAVQSMGGSTWTVVRKVLLPESLPSLISSATTTIVALLGYSAMAGTVGGGGLGDLAIRYGYLRFENELMWIIVGILAVVIAVIQFIGDFAARAVSRRGRSAAPRLRLLRRPAPLPASTSQPVKAPAESGTEPAGETSPTEAGPKAAASASVPAQKRATAPSATVAESTETT